MRARPREINIFNMSLLDILCGALGAFCFMMLVALPYYVVGRVDQAASQKRTEDLLKDVEKLRERMSDPAQAEELRKLIDELEAQIKQLQGQVNQSAYENEQLHKQNDDLTAKNDELTAKNDQQQGRIKQRKPFSVLAWSDNPLEDVDLYLEDDMKEEGTGKVSTKPFDPTKPYHASHWPDDITGLSLPDRGFAGWVSSERVPGAHIRVFVKHGGDKKPQITSTFSALAVGNFGDKRVLSLADVALSPRRFWDLLGTFTVGDDYNLTFKVATQDERDQEWRARKMEPPPLAAPTVVPTATPSQTLSPEDMERLRRKSDELRRMHEEEARARQEREQRSSPSASASPISDEERRVRRERELHLHQRGTTPAPSP